MQGPIDPILSRVREQDIQPAEAQRTEVAVLEAGWPPVVEPQGQKYKPQSVVEAQFSMPFGAAVAVMHRAAGIDQFTEQNARSSSLRRLMGKVVMTKDVRIEKNFPDEWPARVTIELTAGRSHEKLITHPKGDPQNPLTWDELIDTFKSLVAHASAGELVAQASTCEWPA